MIGITRELYRQEKEEGDDERVKEKGMEVGNEVVLGTTKTK